MKAQPDIKKRIAALRRRVNKARNFPTNTCGASRHLHMMALGLLSKRGYPMLTEEPAHCAESILAVLEGLWTLRTKSPQYAKEVARAVAKIKALPTAGLTQESK